MGSLLVNQEYGWFAWHSFGFMLGQEGWRKETNVKVVIVAIAVEEWDKSYWLISEIAN